MPAPKTRSEEAGWYDNFYRAVQEGMAPWYYFMIPHLRGILKQKTKLMELGCGQGHLLRYLVEKNLAALENIYAIDQSKTAVDFVQNLLPGAHVGVGDIYKLEYPSDFFDICLLMETIEHLEQPMPALRGIYSITAPGGLLYVSFPNYLHLPWLAVRLLSDLLNKPNWVVRQPIDIIYTVPRVVKLVEQAGFKLESGIGTTYGLPILYRFEKEWMTNSLNALRLWWISFHPILVFRKPEKFSPAKELQYDLGRDSGG